MTEIQSEMLRRLWRGQSPFRSGLARDAVADVQGWSSQHPYLAEAIKTVRPSIAVEIGVWKGGSVITMARTMRDLGIDGVVIAVDTWLGAWDHWINDRWFAEVGLARPSGGIFGTFLRNVADAGLEDYVVPVPLDSINAAQVLRHFNIRPAVIHVDAGHDYEAVYSDIKHWWPLLEPGGTLIGDDYRAGNDWPGVKRAFDDFFRPLGLLPIENVDEKCRITKPTHDVSEARYADQLREIAEKTSMWRERCRIELAALADDPEIPLQERLQRYHRFDGPDWPPMRARFAKRVASERGKPFQLGPVIGADYELNLAALGDSAQALELSYPVQADITPVSSVELIPGSPSPYTQFALPGGLNKNLGKPNRLALAVHQLHNVDLFLTPIGYQTFCAEQGSYFPAFSTRAYPQQAMQGAKVITERRPVVIVQDTFEGSNFSHFLYDWITRLCHFLDAGLEDARDCVFVMGGIPTEFHRQVIAALCDAYNIKRDQLVFPTEPALWQLKGNTYVFSDARRDIMHPAHGVHRLSMAVLHEIASRVQTADGAAKRIYISRGDTRLRRVSNEHELLECLKPYGFVVVHLGTIPILDQIELVRGADVIVAPHGMGLTHLAFHRRKPTVIEFHNPQVGTDAYASIAYAMGFRYRAVIGTPVPNDPDHCYHVDPSAVMGALVALGVQPCPSAFRRPEITAWHPTGVQSKRTDFGTAPQSSYGIAYGHTRDKASAQPDNNVAWMAVSGFIRGAVYRVSCDVWIGADFNGERVSLSCPALRAGAGLADLSLRGQWQTVSIIGDASNISGNVVLRADGDDCAFFSSGWQIHAGT